MSERIDRINSLVKQEIGYIIQHDLKDSRLGFVTVLRADISKDLKSGKIFISIFGDDETKKRTIEILNHSTGFIQKMLGSRIRLRYLPKLKFIYDDVIEHSIHIQQVLSDIKYAEEDSQIEKNDVNDTNGETNADNSKSE